MGLEAVQNSWAAYLDRCRMPSIRDAAMCCVRLPPHMGTAGWHRCHMHDA